MMVGRTKTLSGKAERAGKASKCVVVMSSLVMGACPAGKRLGRSLVLRLLAHATAQRLLQGRVVDGEAIACLQAGDVLAQNIRLQLARKLVLQTLGLLRGGWGCRGDFGDAKDDARLAVHGGRRGGAALRQRERLLHGVLGQARRRGAARDGRRLL